MKKARAGAQPGDIFVVSARPELIRIVRAQTQGPQGASARRTIMADNPSKPGDPTKVKVAVNAAYPSGEPVSTMPPELLLKLPPLPEGLEYRFVGRTLILHDRDANLIVDFIPEAPPGT